MLVPSRYFNETGHNVGGPFLSFYEDSRGATILGLPITEVLDKRGVQVQYFEYARLEIQPDHPERVVMAPLGELLAQNRMHEPAFVRHDPGPSRVSTFFPSTGHNLSYTFRTFWQNSGGHPVFGSPLSEVFIEYNQAEQRSYTVQYFERARLEYRLDRPGAAPILRVGSLGREVFALQEIGSDALEPARPVETLASSRIHFVPLPGDMQNIGLAARQFDGLKILPGEQVSYLETIGELSVETGYMPGSGIVNGTGGQVIAGGICYLSTAMFRVVMGAGLEVVERHPHTVLLPGLGDAPGMDSAVFTADGKGLNRNGAYDLDLRWRNDLPDAIIITTDVITTGELAVSLWGYRDGRTITIKEPSIEYSSQPGTIWRYDGQMPSCEVKKIATGAPGMRIVVQRDVRSATGNILHNDRYVSSYSSYKDVFVYGPGVTPVNDGSEYPAQQAREICESVQQTE